MEQKDVIIVKNVKKSFRIYKDKGNTIKEKILFRERNRYTVRDVLNGISFKIPRGQAVGLIGHNGCGKSTTLKLLTRIMYPDQGTIKVNGRVSSMLELGAGFHPDMSGRENIYINASIFGLTKKEIDARMQDIIEFSELGPYIDNPVRTYSSGMYMRLAFSVAINVNADVLLIDEILAVGDANFQNKCMKKLRSIKQKGTTIVIVSHSMEQIESFCDRTIWINDGKIAGDGRPEIIDRQYKEFLMDYNFKNSIEHEKKKDETQLPSEDERCGSGELRIDKVEILNEKNEPQKIFEVGEMLQLRIHIRQIQKRRFNVYFDLFRDGDNFLCYGTVMENKDHGMVGLAEDGYITVQFPKLPLIPSDYRFDIRLQKEDGKCIDEVDHVGRFQTVNTKAEAGLFRMNYRWTVK